MSLFSSIQPPRQSRNGSSAQAGQDDPTYDPDDSTRELDPDKLEHDRGVVQGVTAQAITIMANSGMHLSEEELETARGIMPKASLMQIILSEVLLICIKVAGLARRVNDSPSLSNTFSEVVCGDPDLQGSLRALTRRVATRWNTDRAALNNHIYFKGPVQWLTGSRRSLQKYALDPKQWDLAAELSSVLEVGLIYSS